MRLKADGTTREVAWEEFYRLYSPIIARFARARGVRPSEIEELANEIVSGFFAAQPRFVYDPSRGRFRAYLMACVANAVRSRVRRERSASSQTVSASEVASSDEVDWDLAWKQSALESALARLRERYADNPTFQAFESTVVRGQPPDVVAASLGMSRESVYQAKTRLLAKLRLELDEVERALDPL
jgi:RNA polymerase sigma-70 factor (ECF subfamily)